MSSSWVNDSTAALLADFYEFTMLQSYFDEGMNDIAVFDLFVRRLPANRNYLIACGLEHVLQYLETASFSSGAIEYLRSLGCFSGPFLKSIADFKFTGDVYAVAEGTVVFPNEPIIEIIAPLPHAQIVETFVMNQIQLATLAGSKAARVVLAAGGRPVADFGLRRMHGTDAGVKEPRAFHIAGVEGTSSVLAGQVYGIPVVGTMGHSYVQACDSELEAFRRFARAFPEAILLVDTYDTLKGVGHVIELARELGSQFQVSGIRLDSGDLDRMSREARKLLDNAGLNQVRIIASGSLDEYKIESLLASGAPIDGFGVGTSMSVSEDAPSLDTAYKLVEYAGRARIKLSEHKSTLPGRKQVFRERANGKFKRDLIGLQNEALPGDPLLVKVMEAGKRVQPPTELGEARARCRAELNSLPDVLLRLSKVDPGYEVVPSAALVRLNTEIKEQLEMGDSPP